MIVAIEITPRILAISKFSLEEIAEEIVFSINLDRIDGTHGILPFFRIIPAFHLVFVNLSKKIAFENFVRLEPNTPVIYNLKYHWHLLRFNGQVDQNQTANKVINECFKTVFLYNPAIT